MGAFFPLPVLVFSCFPLRGAPVPLISAQRRWGWHECETLGMREQGKGGIKPGDALTTPAPFLALSSSWKKFSSSLPSM